MLATDCVSAPQELCKCCLGSCMGTDICRLPAFDVPPRKYRAKSQCHYMPNLECLSHQELSPAFNLDIHLPRGKPSFQVSQLTHEVDTFNVSLVFTTRQKRNLRCIQLGQNSLISCTRHKLHHIFVRDRRYLPTGGLQQGHCRQP